MWRYGCPRSPDWDSDVDGQIDHGVEEKGVSEDDAWNTRFVLEGLFGSASVRAFSVPDDVLCIRTTARKWNVAGLFGPLPNSTSSL